MAGMERRVTLSAAAIIGITDTVQEDDVVNKQLFLFLNQKAQLLWMGLLREGLDIGKERRGVLWIMYDGERLLHERSSQAQEVTRGKGYKEVGGERINTAYTVTLR